MNGVCARSGGSVVGVKQVPRDQVSAYGVLDPAAPIDEDGVIPIADIVEKPTPQMRPATTS